MFSRALNFEPINTEQSFTQGDVVIVPGAVIAPGVLLQADIGSQIVIRSGVCIGLGSVIHASGGTIIVNEGANLGAGVLLIGTVTIGARACLGAAVTVIDSMVAPGMILEAGTLMGGRSRQVSVDELINTIPMNPPLNSEIPSTESGPDLKSISSPSLEAIVKPIVQSIVQPSVSAFVEPPIKPNVDSLKLNLNQNSTFQYPSETKVETIAAGVVVDSSGKPWQSCAPNPWDPTNHPPGETTCQVTSKPKDQTTFDPTLFSSQNYSSPYPPYQQQPQSSTIASPVVESPIVKSSVTNSIAPNPAPVEPVTQPSIDVEPKAVYGQDYVNRMLGKMSGR